MNASRLLVASVLGVLFLSLLLAGAQEAAREQRKKVQAGQPAAGPKDGPPKKEELNKVDLASLEKEAAKGVLSATNNGVELAIKLKTVPNKESTDIQVAWTIKYTGPRPPLIIVPPTLEFGTAANTMIQIYAAPKGKDYALPYTVAALQADLPRMKTKDWFVTVPAGKSAQGVLTVSGEKLKAFLLKHYPGEFDAKQPPRLFMDVLHNPFDRGEDFNLDSWIGDLNVLNIAVPALPKW